MTITFDATYENGVLKPQKPLSLAEGAQVRVTLHPIEEGPDPLAAVIGIGASGRSDGADQHDHYIYGTRKQR
jgi:predicted DNA-binding antitoxin AbrB/MazE fold protein